MPRLTRRAVLGTAASAALTRPAPAQDFPRRPIQLIVPFPAGGSTDVGARIVASIAEKDLGQPVIVVNRTGAAGQLGWTEAARAKPDGYTLAFINLPTMNAVILDPERKAMFGLDSFVPVVNQVLDPSLLWVRADSRFKSMADLVAAAKQAPNTISASIIGILSDDHFATLMLREATGAEFRLVNFDGAAPSVTAILGGHVEVSFDNVGNVFPRLRAGDGRGLAVMDTKRSKFLPDVPTTVELGYPTVISNSSRGIAAPKGTPDAVLQVLEAAFGKAMNDPEHVRKLEETGQALHVLNRKDYAAYYADLHANAAKYAEWALKQR